MLVGTCYPSDDNEQLKDVQHELYWQLVPQLFATARAELLRADERDVGELLVSRYGFEHWGFADGYAKRYRPRWSP